jgi:transcriptional regulator with XRE-family HTH domain
MAKADLERARQLYPSCAMGMDEWTAFFGSAAGLRAMGRIIYDVYDEVVSREERENGKRRIGRRPAREATTLAKVMAIVKPEEFTNEPLPIALRQLLRGRSQRQFARKVPISQPYLNRLLAGKFVTIDLEMLENLADAAGVPAWHFPEWRAMYIGGLITEVLAEHPALGITALRALRNTRRAGEEKVPIPTPVSLRKPR